MLANGSKLPCKKEVWRCNIWQLEDIMSPNPAVKDTNVCLLKTSSSFPPVS